MQKIKPLRTCGWRTKKLRREVEYQNLKVAGYERLLEIVKHEDGIDLLKKDGARQ